MKRRKKKGGLPAAPVPSTLRLLDDPAAKTAAGVSRRLRLQIIRLLVEDDRLPDDRVGAGLDRQHIGDELQVPLAVLPDLDVAEVPIVARRLARAGVRVARRVEVTA